MCWASNVGKKAFPYFSFGENPQDKTKETKGKGNWINCLKWLGCVPKNLQNLNFLEEQNHRVHTERQWPLSGVHSIMMVKSAQPGGGGGGGSRPTPFTLSTIMNKVVVSARWEGRYSPISPLQLYIYCIYTPWEKPSGQLATTLGEGK